MQKETHGAVLAKQFAESILHTKQLANCGCEELVRADEEEPSLYDALQLGQVRGGELPGLC